MGNAPSTQKMLDTAGVVNLSYLEDGQFAKIYRLALLEPLNERRPLRKLLIYVNILQYVFNPFRLFV